MFTPSNPPITGAANLRTLFAKRSNIFRIGFWKMLYEMYRFGKNADSVGQGLDASMTLGDFLHDENYSKEFINYFIIRKKHENCSCNKNCCKHRAYNSSA